MKKLLGVIVAVVLAVGLAGCSEPAEKDFARIRGAVKELKQMDPADGKVKVFCSGVMLKQGLLLTAAHCDTGKDVEVFVNGYKAIPVKVDVKRDLMLMYVPAGAPCPCVGELSAVERDEKVYAVGFPLDAGQVLTEGRWQHEARDAVGKELGFTGQALYTAPATFGNSGGGVFVYRGGDWFLAGIVSRGTIIPLGGFIPAIIDHLQYGASADSISAFIAGE